MFVGINKNRYPYKPKFSTSKVKMKLCQQVMTSFKEGIL